MTIYWERCSICSRHYPTRSCWLNPALSICPYCCIACTERERCPRPVWFPSLKPSKTIQPRLERGVSRREAVKALEELLKKLGEE